MPDPKKLAVLEGVGFVLREVCASCVYFVAGAAWWGSCRRITPTHSKHTDGARVSVHATGWCPQYEVDGARASEFLTSGFVRFIPKEEQHGGQ